MNYTQLTESDVRHMLDTTGAERVEDLFRDIPPESRLQRSLDLPAALTELELLDELDRLARANHDCNELTCFLGGGMYDHFIPTVVDALASQSEFVTAYTPYQAEASQGSLQAFYEYQTLICQLTGMDVSNASLYEGSTATAEAVLMARSHTGRRRVVVSVAVHPDTRAVLATYLRELPMELTIVQTAGGRTDVDDLRRAVNDETAAVVVANPNFFGCVEPLGKVAALAHERGAVVIAAVDPISCGLLKTPGELGADIVVGDGQPLGIPMSYGGPTCGFMACKAEFMRKMPGRLVGATTDRSGRRAYCLTLQTREQHIRRERATSNICTNQGLLALRVAIYLS
ncbi:MAG: aminomethyl-transferring glycine dehydrogenase subunit GcvPA, partial [Planctomycetes bacterium]|nr:aminomethyl-transferring glycine dehydrogenase subunit GcvPA [Planctomycetota bacterium]